MGLRINTNVDALNGYRSVNRNNAMLSGSLQRLSSGLRINKAADDAAGLVISEQMRAQITGLNQATANSETAVNMVQTAEGALDEMNTLFKKVRSLALHAANAAPNDKTQLLADQSELDNAVASITRIAKNTQFGTKKLLDGTLAAANSFDTNKIYRFDVGTQLLTRADFTAGQVCMVIDSSAETSTVFKMSTTLWADIGTSNTFSAAGNGSTVSALTASVIFGGNSIGSFFTSGVAANTANFAFSTEAITLRVEDTTFSLATATSASTFTGSAVVSWMNTVQSVYTVQQDASGLVVIRNSTGTVGATRDLELGFRAASFSTTEGSGGVISLNISLAGTFSTVSFGNNQATTIKTSGTAVFSGYSVTGGSLGETVAVVAGNGSALAGTANLRDILGNATNRLNTDAQMTISVAGKDYVFSNGETIGDMVSYINTQQTDYILDTDRDYGINMVRSNIGAGGASTDLAISLRDSAGRLSYMKPLATDQVELTSGVTGSAVPGSNDGGIDNGVNILAHLEGAGLPGGRINLVSTSDDASVLRNNGNGIEISTDTEWAKRAEAVTANLTNGALFQTGANSGQLVGVDIKDVSATKLGLGADSTRSLLSLQSIVDKQALVNGLFNQALAVIDKAIDDVTSLRGELGAFQANTLETGLNSLRTTNENLSAAESTIRDTDFAKESSTFAKNQILVQASTSMLAQANQTSQNVLSLLGR